MTGLRDVFIHFLVSHPYSLPMPNEVLASEGIETLLPRSRYEVPI